VLRHELGHTIGARHEHTRPEAGTCYEDSDWRPLTSYDAFSVMHYPQCHGRGDWALILTAKDKFGAACLYGATAATSFDLAGCPGGAPTRTAKPRERKTAMSGIDGDWLMADEGGVLTIKDGQWHHPRQGVADIVKGQGAASYEVQYPQSRGVICSYVVRKMAGSRLFLEASDPTQPADYCPSGVLTSVDE
jgi:hypothetical protein